MTNAASGAVISPAMVVQNQDAGGNVVTIGMVNDAGPGGNAQWNEDRYGGQGDSDVRYVVDR